MSLLISRKGPPGLIGPFRREWGRQLGVGLYPREQGEGSFSLKKDGEDDEADASQ